MSQPNLVTDPKDLLARTVFVPEPDTRGYLRCASECPGIADGSEALERGMEAKSQDFRAEGGELYPGAPHPKPLPGGAGIQGDD